MKFIKWVTIIIIISFPGMASGEFFKYLDQDGNVRYTDDLSQVPENQRESVPGYTESQSSAKTPAVVKPLEKDETKKPPSAESIDETEVKLTGKELKARREALRKEHDILIQRQRELSSNTKKRFKSKAKAKEYKREQNELNELIRRYEETRKAYEADVKIHNANIEALHEQNMREAAD